MFGADKNVICVDRYQLVKAEQQDFMYCSIIL